MEGLTVGVLAPFVGGDYYGGLIAGVTGAAAARGGRVLAVQTLAPGARRADSEGIPDWDAPVGWAHADAFVVVIGAVDEQHLARLHATGKPVVLISHRSATLPLHAVLPDNRAGVRDAVTHLIGHGHTRIAFAGALNVPDIRERLAGYRAALAAHGLPELVIAAADNHERGGRLAAETMLADGLPSTAVVCGTDRNALGLAEALTAAGHRLPDAQAVVGFDDIPAALHAEPALASVAQPLNRIGAAAVAALSDGAGVTYVPTVFVPRESCGCDRPAPLPLDPALAARLADPAVGVAEVADALRGHLLAELDQALYGLVPDRRARAILLRVAQAQARANFGDIRYLQDTLNAQYQLGTELLRTDEQDPRALGWLRRLPVRAGCLGLWSRDGHRALEISGAFHCETGPSPAPVEDFPPAGLFAAARPEAGEIVFVISVRSVAQDWGLLATVARIQDKTPPGREPMNQSGALLAVALDQEFMLRSLRDQEERLRRTALYDQLTGLPNRGLFLDRLRRAVDRAQRDPAYTFAVLFLDLDGFKSVNDTLGHAAGDQLLVQTAARISALLRDTDTAARFGGDEFLVLLDDIDGPQGAAAVAERAHLALAEPFELHEGTARVSASIGSALSTDGHPNAEALLRVADSTMYEAKSAHRASAPPGATRLPIGLSPVDERPTREA
ncbi:GGDEF domain-containing protein [Catenuloplanes atrovinosus]|uniref:Diguanylate cyclase (GGDEF)-like protein n=1 Tax=Catenuloplanes atrovinosus TaxID=137266 RepID=A0AAE3YU73_9ACTN|nr:GGDEF domain-containing protein [Catenuloplanes atrovinosus]MDR7278717.1 diguanylate cyclase (GGDEF)-like protein [Catenuloplanes atrovinosus]